MIEISKELHVLIEIGQGLFYALCILVGARIALLLIQKLYPGDTDE